MRARPPLFVTRHVVLLTTRSYTAFASDVALKYYTRQDLVLFLAWGPMTNYYQGLVERTIANLRAKVCKLDAPVCL